MAPITIPDQAPVRVSYTVGGTPDDTFIWPFRLFAATDIKIYVDGDPTPVSFTVPTVLPVSAGATVILDVAVSNATVVLVGDLPVKRTVNFPTAGPFPIDTLNEQLNELFAILQEQESRIDRCLVAAPWSIADFSNLQLPDPVDGEVPAWLGNDGAMQNTPAGVAGPVGPTGAAGADGADGLDINWLGTYNAGTTYEINDAVSFGGSSYISIAASHSGNQPNVSPAQWDVLAAQGAAGAGSGDMLVATYDPVGHAQQTLGISFVQTMTNKTFNLSNNTLTGTKAEFLTACSDGAFAFLGTKQAYSKQQNFALQSLIDAASIVWDLDDNQVADVTLTANRALANPTNPVAGGTYILIVKQDGSGTHTLAFGANYKFPGGVAPVVAAGANEVSVLTFVYDGTNMLGVSQEDFS